MLKLPLSTMFCSKIVVVPATISELSCMSSVMPSNMISSDTVSLPYRFTQSFFAKMLPPRFAVSAGLGRTLLFQLSGFSQCEFCVPWKYWIAALEVDGASSVAASSAVVVNFSEMYRGAGFMCVHGFLPLK